MSYKNKLPNCFGSIDRVFASHPLDEKRALDVLRECYGAGVTTKQVLSAAGTWMKKEGCGKTHIAAQKAKIRKYFHPWLG